MVNGSFGECAEADHDDRDVVTRVADLMPDLTSHLHKAFCCDVKFSSLVEGNHQSHYLLILEVLPDSI